MLPAACRAAAAINSAAVLLPVTVVVVSSLLLVLHLLLVVLLVPQALLLCTAVVPVSSVSTKLRHRNMFQFLTTDARRYVRTPPVALSCRALKPRIDVSLAIPRTEYYCCCSRC